MDILWRLAWALPLVLGVGVVAVLTLRRFITPMRPASGAGRRLSAQESLSLSDNTRVHLIDLDGTPYLLVESDRQAVLHCAPTQPGTGRQHRLSAPWLQRFYAVKPR